MTWPDAYPTGGCGFGDLVSHPVGELGCPVIVQGTGLTIESDVTTSSGTPHRTVVDRRLRCHLELWRSAPNAQ